MISVAKITHQRSKRRCKASVEEDGKLQVFAATQKVTGDVEFSGNLAGEIGFGDAKDVTVKDIDVTTVAGSQEAVAIIDGALKSVDSQRASLGAFQTVSTTLSAT